MGAEWAEEARENGSSKLCGGVGNREAESVDEVAVVLRRDGSEATRCEGTGKERPRFRRSILHLAAFSATGYFAARWERQLMEQGFPSDSRELFPFLRFRFFD